MNTDGLNLGSSIRGKANLLNTKGSSKDNKSESFDQQKSEGPGTFSQVLERRSEQVTGTRRDDRQEDTPSVKERDLEKLDKPKAKKANSAREQAMLDFMDSMESELGIPPQRMLEAMAQLPEDKILQSPEETASQVIDDLDLPPEQAEQAYAKYMSFLGQLQQMPQPQVATPVVAQTQNPQGALSANGERVLTVKEKREMLNDSLDRLSQKFFMQGPRTFETAQKTADPTMLERISARQQQDGFNADGMQAGLTADGLKAGFDPGQNIGAQNPMQPVAPQPQLQPQAYSKENAAMMNAMKAAKPEDASSLPPELMAKLSALGASAAALGQSVQKTPSGQAVVESQAGQQAAGGASAFQVGPSLTAMGLAGGGQQASDDSSEFGDSDSSQDQKSLKADGLGLKGHMGSLAGEKTMGFRDALNGATVAAPMNSTNRQETVQNMQKVMDQAQLIARKGGGEAVVRVNPEGLGEVHMKVVVKDGRVNLEMATESKEAKRAIEESLGDLKMGLSQHKLAVDSVKVDVGLKNSNDNQQHQHQQQQKDFSQMNQGREQARQFFQQFHEENMGKREAFFEMPGIKAYRQPSKSPPPLTEVSAESRARAQAQGRGERMNLVA